MEEAKLAKLKKLSTLQEEPNLAFFDELEEVIEELKELKELNSRDVKTYEEEFGGLGTLISNLTETLKGKDMVVNVESNKKELSEMSNVLKSILEESKKEQSINVKLVIK